MFHIRRVLVLIAHRAEVTPQGPRCLDARDSSCISIKTPASKPTQAAYSVYVSVSMASYQRTIGSLRLSNPSRTK